jgi:putative transposase
VLWQDESYDHIIRNEADYREKARYIWENPVRRGLVADPATWPWWGCGQQGE